MKVTCNLSIGLLLLLLSVCCAVSEDESDHTGESKVDTILQSDRLFHHYVSCIVHDGPCTADGRTFKQYLPDALENSCRNCSKAYMSNIKKIVSYIRNERRGIWEEFNKKFNPNGNYNKFLAEL